MPRLAGNNSLFERLGNDEIRLRTKTSEPNITERIGAIKSNLERILNTRQGCSQSSPDEGLVDFNDATLGSQYLVQRICEDIRRVITAGEPRVVVKGIRFVADPDDPLALNFRIDCLIPIKSKKELVEIDLVMNSGQFQVR